MHADKLKEEGKLNSSKGMRHVHVALLSLL